LIGNFISGSVDVNNFVLLITSFDFVYSTMNILFIYLFIILLTNSDQTRGEASAIVVTTGTQVSPSTESPPTSILPPNNLRFDQIDLTSLRVLWDIPFLVAPVDHYR